MWRSEIARALHNFEEDVGKVIEQLDAKAGCDPEMYKINGMVSDEILSFSYFSIFKSRMRAQIKGRKRIYMILNLYYR